MMKLKSRQLKVDSAKDSCFICQPLDKFSVRANVFSFC